MNFYTSTYAIVSLLLFIGVSIQSNEQIAPRKLFPKVFSESEICFFSGNESNSTYSEGKFNLSVEVESFGQNPLEISISLDDYIYKLKQIVTSHTGYRCDEQRLVLVCNQHLHVQEKLKDGKKLGDYMSLNSTTCNYKLKVEKRLKNANIIFNTLPNVTDYEYARMSLHVYQPNKVFLRGWKMIRYNTSNKNGLSLALYYHPESHQSVVAIRGTDSKSDFLSNLITDSRLFFTNHMIDILDAARMELFHDNVFHIPHTDGAPYVISFTGHSLGAGLAESLACICHSYAVTFDSPGTKHILYNDRLCRQRMAYGYEPEQYVRIYLGPFANLINVARPQYGRITYIKQFGDDNGPDSFFYAYSSVTCIFLPACIILNIIEKRLFKFSLGVTFVCLTLESTIVRSLANVFYPYPEVFQKLINLVRSPCEYLHGLSPVLVMLILLCYSISTLANSIELWTMWIIDRFRPNVPDIAVISRFVHRIPVDGVVCRLVVLLLYFILSLFIHIGIPVLIYYWWLTSIHTIENFVQAFNPDNGKPYEGQYIESNAWPTIKKYLTEITPRQFLLILLLIQTLKIVAFNLLPILNRRLRLNVVLLALAMCFNIGCRLHLYGLFISLIWIGFKHSQNYNEHYTRNLVCIVCGLLATKEILHERHSVEKIYCEMISYTFVILLFLKRRFL